MDPSFQQFVLLDTLLENWAGIQVRMGMLSAAQDAELARVAAQLAAAQQPGQVAVALDRLLDITEDTAAYAYVRQLVQRCAVPATATTRGGMGVQASAEYAALSTMQTSAALAAVAAPGLGFDTVPIFFVTNRKEEPGRPLDERYSGEYSQQVSYGRADVTIPRRTHRIGQVERPVPWVGREDVERHVVMGGGESFSSSSFGTALARDLVRCERKELLVFLHGYRVTFEEAARRAAQVASDVRFGGLVLLFSWPSAGKLMAYGADEDSAAKSAEPLRALLRELEGGPWERVHVLAHSMGNRVMVSSLAGREQGWSLPIQNVVLVAADLDVELFQQQFPLLRERVQQGDAGLVTSYTSSTDRALGISSWLHSSTRLGRLDRLDRWGESPRVMAGMETVDASATDTSLIGLHHGYFAEQRSLLTDLGLLLRERLPAARRGLAPVQGQWWAFPQ